MFPKIIWHNNAVCLFGKHQTWQEVATDFQERSQLSFFTHLLPAVKTVKKKKTKTMIRKAKPLTRATQQLKVRIVLTFKKA